jgi:predicted DCC family thiol-disulfide oxidoreductase YuxK
MTTSYVVKAMKLGVDKKGRDRSLFLYDGGCGVCKFTVRMVAHFDHYDHIRFRPLQTTTAVLSNDGNDAVGNDDDDPQMKDLYLELGIRPFDLSTAVLLEGTNNRIYTKSEAILHLLSHMGFPFTFLGPLLILFVPKFLRYTMFAKYRSPIWVYIKRMTGIKDTSLCEYRSKVILPSKYIENPTLIPKTWGLIEPSPIQSKTTSDGVDAEKKDI